MRLEVVFAIFAKLYLIVEQFSPILEQFWEVL